MLGPSQHYGLDPLMIDMGPTVWAWDRRGTGRQTRVGTLAPSPPGEYDGSMFGGDAVCRYLLQQLRLACCTY